MDLKSKNVFIIEGPDASGKSELCKHLQNLAEGKCHILHSNFSKSLPKENHHRQHKMIAKFVSKQFDNKHYTGNNFVILDRNYISDIVYGSIGYGSKGSITQKIKYLDKIFKILTNIKDINVCIFYCRPDNTKFSETVNSRKELLSETENKLIINAYDKFFRSNELLNLFIKYKNLSYKKYNFYEDPNYEHLDFFIKNGYYPVNNKF